MARIAIEVDMQRLRQNVAIATFQDGGLLLHLPSGNIFQLDTTAGAVWRALIEDADLGTAMERVSGALGIDAARARLMLEAAATEVLSRRAGSEENAYRFDDSGASIDLHKHGRTILRFDRERSCLTLVDKDGPEEGQDLWGLVGLFVPKILATWFPLTLHASAVAVAGGALLFSGASGAGKTTTAHTIAGQITDARLVSEDLVVFSQTRAGVAIVTAGEPIVRTWINDATAALAHDVGASMDVESLGRAIRESHDSLMVKKVIFLEADNRRGECWSFDPVGRGQALRPLFLNSFLPSSDAAILRGHLLACAEIAAVTPMWKAVTIPEGLARLRAGSRAQSEMIAS